MHSALIGYIEALRGSKLSERESDLLLHAFVPRKLKKHQFFLQQGDVCRSAGFIVKGALKQYSVDPSGKEHILGLYIENWWAGDRESFVSGAPSLFYIDALEETELLVVTREKYFESLNAEPFMIDLVRLLTERQAAQLLRRVHAIKTLSAEQKLADLESVYPEFFERFPQHVIASYLGMTKETYSRIKAGILRK